jgi:hypothetical protein
MDNQAIGECGQRSGLTEKLRQIRETKFAHSHETDQGNAALIVISISAGA